MDNLTESVLAAQQNNAALDALISDYLPFIKSEMAKAGDLGLEYDDRLSLSMLAFMQCVRQYQANRGAFLPFAAAGIRSRLIDEARRQRRHSSRAVPLLAADEQLDLAGPERELAAAQYGREEERRALAEEIDALAEALGEQGITFRGLGEVAPRQKRSRNLAAVLARTVLDEENLRQSFVKHRRLPRSELAQKLGISEKTIEKHRVYIVALLTILLGDYPGIRAFLPAAALETGKANLHREEAGK